MPRDDHRNGMGVRIDREPCTAFLADCVHNGGMIPDPRKHNPTHGYFLELRTRINASAEWVSQNSGISRRRLNYLAVGQRDGGAPVVMSYPEQFTLEALAEYAERIPEKKTVRGQA